MTRTDGLVILLTLLTLPLLYLKFWGDGGNATTVEIITAGQPPQRWSLLRDQTLQVDGPLGPSTIAIEAGKAAFIHSPCTGQHCVHSGWLARNGDVAVCLPNRIMLSVAGTVRHFDSINF